ncbi:MAG: winged helix-turn-helix domain-containing protein [Actinomycetota bacterium]
MRFEGDGWTLDADEFIVRSGGEPVDLEPQAVDVLLHLVQNRGRLVTKIEMLDAVWGDQFVGDAALATRISQVRRALGDDGRTQAMVRTVHGRGYRFVGEVAEIAGPGVVGVVDDPPTPVDESDTRRVDTPSQRPDHNIPAARVEMVGRRREVAEIVEALTADRLVTLIGLGGVGKTTLAAEVARRCVDRFRHGVGFVDLIPAVSSDLHDTIATELGVVLSGDDRRAALIDRLADRERLFVLDNCEHLADEVAELCDGLLDRAPHVRVLATSRVALGVVGERRMPISPLPITDPDGGAIDLLDAVATRWGAEIPPQHRSAAIALCTRADGLPLAIELIGARLATMSVPDVVARLDALLGSRSRDRRHDRHASLVAVLGDTLDALDHDETRLIELLGRLSGPFTVSDVESIAFAGGVTDPDETLSGLLDRSLVTRTVGVDGTHAHRVLETVRQQALARSSEPGDVADAHADWCLAAVGDSIFDHYYDIDAAGWKERRYADIALAEQRLLDVGRASDAARLRAATGLTMHFDEGTRAASALEAIERRLDDADGPEVVARLHCTGVFAAMAARDPSRLVSHGERAVSAADTAGSPSIRALARVLRSWSGVIVDPHQAFADLDEALVLATSVDDVETIAIARGYQVFNLAMSRRFDEAVELAERAFAECRARPTYPTRTVAQGLICCLVVDDPARALAIDADMRSRSMTSSPWGMDVTRQIVLASAGDLAGAQTDLVSLLRRLDRVGVDPFPDELLVPAAAALHLGETDRAARYLGAVRHAGRQTQSLMVSVSYRVLRDHVPPAEAADVGSDPRAVADEARAWLESVVRPEPSTS